MNLLNIIKLARVLSKLEMISTDKGVLTIESVKIGGEVYRENDGNVEIAKDGDYTLEDKRVLVIKDGKISEVREPAAVEETNPGETANALACDPEEEKKEEMEGEGTAEPAEPTDKVAEPAEEPKEDEKDARIKELEAEIAEKAAEIEGLKAEIEVLKAAPVEEKMAKVEVKWPFKTYKNR